MVQSFSGLKADSVHGQFGQILVQGVWLTNQVTKVDAEFKRDFAKGSGMGAKAENNLPGQASGTIKVEALTGRAMERALARYKLLAEPIFAASMERGIGVGSPALAMPASIGEYSKSYGKEDEATVTMELGCRGDFHDGIIQVSPKKLEKGTAGAWEGVVDDNGPYGGPTDFGGCAYLFVTDIVGGTTPTVQFKWQGSSDDGVGDAYTDLAVFEPASMADPETLIQQVYVSSTSVIERYTQVIATEVGTPTGWQALLITGRDYDPTPANL